MLQVFQMFQQGMGHVHHRTGRAWKISHKLQNRMNSDSITVVSESLQVTHGLFFQNQTLKDS